MTENPNVTIGDDEAALEILDQVTPHAPATQKALDRLSTWEGAVELELQDLITQAAKIRQEMNASKTPTKRKYFDKKFKKVTSDVMQMITTLDRLKQHRASLNPSNDQPTVA